MANKDAAPRGAKKYEDLGTLKSAPAPTKVQYNQTSPLMAVPPGETRDPVVIEVPKNTVVRRPFKAREQDASKTQVQVLDGKGRILFSGTEAEFDDLKSLIADEEG